jgi:hypothetical protein
LFKYLGVALTPTLLINKYMDNERFIIQMPKNLADQHFDERAGLPPFSGNLLAKYFRVPGVHVKLPTHGAFMPAGSVNFTMNDEVPVYPMRMADELLLKSPDALMNGYAIEKLIESCVPAIKFPRLISSPDLDVILMAIRAATLGEIITLSPACPKCDVINEVYRNLGHLLSTVTEVAPENVVRLSDEVVAYVRPHNLENATKLGIASFEEARKVQALDVSEADQTTRAAQISRSMARLGDLNSDTIADCIVKVTVPEGTVTDARAIREFIANISKAWSDKISAMLEMINRQGIDKFFEVTCAACGHQWKADIEFNPSTFFDSGSSAS